MVFGFLWFSSGILLDISFILGGITYLFSVAFLIVVFQRVFLKLISWELSNWVVTKRLIIHFKNNLLTNNDVVYISIPKIDEMEKKKHGFLSNFFRYGDVHVNIAAAPYPIICHRVPYPGDFTNLIKAIRDGRADDELDVKVYQNIYGRKFRSLLLQTAK
jgi:hypothetical protein